MRLQPRILPLIGPLKILPLIGPLCLLSAAGCVTGGVGVADRPAVRTAAADGPAAPVVEPVEEEIVRRTQRRLAALGYAPGPADGVLGPRTAAAIEAFQVTAGLRPTGRPDTATVLALDALHQTRLTAEVQRRLVDLGYDPGPVDGELGPRTRDAVRDFQAAAGLGADGQVSARLLEHLAAASLAATDTTVADDGAAAPSLSEAAAADRDRVLRPGDRIALDVGSDELAGSEFSIGKDGSLLLPSLGRVEAAGLTVTELEKIVAVRLLENYLRGLSVRIDVPDAPSLSAGGD